MTTDHARDDWADARTDATLRSALDGLADAGAQASRLDEALGAVRTRVRRRRAAKRAGLGMTVLTVVAALAVGGAALLPDPPQPLPGPAGKPTESTTGAAEDATAGDATCSAAGLDVAEPDWSDLTEPVRTTAHQILRAALACDDEELIRLAQQYPRATDANWGGRSARELLELPGTDQDTGVYAALVGILTSSRPCTPGGGLGNGGPAPVEWPVMAGETVCPTLAQDWQDLVDAGVLTPEGAEEMAGDGWGTSEYTGWRTVVTGDGEWQQLVDGSWEDNVHRG